MPAKDRPVFKRAARRPQAFTFTQCIVRQAYKNKGLMADTHTLLKECRVLKGNKLKHSSTQPSQTTTADACQTET